MLRTRKICVSLSTELPAALEHAHNRGWNPTGAGFHPFSKKKDFRFPSLVATGEGGAERRVRVNLPSSNHDTHSRARERKGEGTWLLVQGEGGAKRRVRAVEFIE